MIEIPDMLGQLGANASREAIGVQYRKGLDLRTLLQQLCLKQFPYIHAAIPIHQTVNILFGVAWSHTPPFVAESLCKLHQDTGPVKHVWESGGFFPTLTLAGISILIYANQRGLLRPPNSLFPTLFENVPPGMGHCQTTRFLTSSILDGQIWFFLSWITD